MPRCRLAIVLAIVVAALGLPGQAMAQATVPTQPIDPFGLPVTLTAKPIVAIAGQANWDTAFETLVDAFKTLQSYLDKAGLKAAGPAMTIYTATDDTGFHFQAALPLAEPPKAPPGGNITIGMSPAGKALKFVHRGSYDTMDNTYEAITNDLDEKNLEMKDLFVEEYVTDPVTTPMANLVINVFVPIK